MRLIGVADVQRELSAIRAEISNLSRTLGRPEITRDLPRGVPQGEVRRVDEGRHATSTLRLRDHVERESRLSRRLRAVDLRDPPARQASHAERRIQ